jgi:cobalt/nickel transport system permease protein
MLDTEFTDIDSAVHRFDPRLKILVAALYSIVVAASFRWSAVLAALCLAIFLSLAARLPPHKLAFRLLWVNGFIGVLWVFLPFAFQGEPFFSIGPLSATKDGVVYVALLTLRANAILLTLICLLSTIPVFTLARALGDLKLSPKLIQLFFFTYRYLHVIHQEYERLRRTMQARGFRPKTNLHTYRSYAFLTGMLMVRSYDRSWRVKNAMLCRGFAGKFYGLSEFALKPADYIKAALLLGAVAVIALLQWTEIIF